ncbi:DNA polymerase III subunit alpha [Streptomyces sp. NPDC008079]|uniref:DNA polymerase III subunit alpha n=1 Tax=Streptomyces sp. NPDC008079 TaxID=3364806 RepID=UPI0036E7D0BC
MLRLISSYAPPRTPETTVDGLTAALPAVVEQDTDGSRWLLTGTTVPESALRRAVKDGAVGVLVLVDDGLRAAPPRQFDGNWGSLGSLPLFPHANGAPTYGDVLSNFRATPSRPPAGTFAHLHTHSEFSALDGLSRMDEVVREVVRHGQTAVAVTDHGTCAGHPALQRAADSAGINPVFGIEANLTDDRLMRGDTIPEGDPRFHGHTKTTIDNEGVEKEAPIPPARMLQNHYWHLCLFAENDTGLRNIWAASTESHRDGFYGRARMDWDTLARHNEGVIASTGCLRGPVAVALAANDLDLAMNRLTRLMDLFPGRLYVELQPNGMHAQIRLNSILVELARQFDLPLLATVDSHFPAKDDADAHHTWISCQTTADVEDQGDLFSQDLSLYVMGEAEVRAGLAYLGQDVVDEAVANTVALADRCTARINEGSSTPSFSGDQDEDERLLRQMCLGNWNRLPASAQDQAAGPHRIYRERFEREMELLVDKGFCGYYLMVADYCGWAKDNGILVGPGRGSGGGSLVAYLARITSLDPVRHDLMFERFLTKGRSGLPDFDVDFPASKKAEILGYLRSRWGEKYVVSIGTELRLKNKAVINELSRALKSRLPDTAFTDLRKVCQLIDDAEAGSAGLGMSWEDLWLQHGDELQPYADRYPYVFQMAERLVGRLKSYGRHAAGVVISTDRPLTDWLPLRRAGEEEQMVTQFPMGDVEALGLVKFDILTLRTLDTVQQTLDLVHRDRGIRIDPEQWEHEFEDPQVWEELRAAHTAGIFQIDTPSGTRLCERMHPRNLDELADMITIVRPGPMRSGLTDVYLRRRAGEQAVSFPDERLRRVLEPTWGAMIYQEQVMAVTRVLAGYDENESDAVRKILGKKKVAAVHAAGQEFVRRADIPAEDAEHLWAQMAEFAKYGFGKAHAYGYAVLAYWTAFLKVNYPLEFLAALMSTVENDKIPGFVKESRRVGVAVLPPDINISGSGFAVDRQAYAVRYGLDSVKGIGSSAVADLQAGQPYKSWQDFETRKGPKVNSGVVALLSRVGALDSLVTNRRALDIILLARKTGTDSACVHKTAAQYPRWHPPLTLPPAHCDFDWKTEPAPVNPRTGKKKKRKPLPVRCTKACRQYTPPPPINTVAVEPYTEADIREIEQEMLGTYLTSTPFDLIDPADRAACRDAAERLTDGPNGYYILAAIITSVRPHPAKDMGFLGLETEVSTVSAAVFSDSWAAERPRLKAGQLCFVEVRKTDRGLNLSAYLPQ